MHPRRRAYAILACLAFLGACASDGEGDVDPLRSVDVVGASAEQQSEIEDRVITESEYHEAFERYRTCLRDEGFELEDVVFRNMVYHAAVPDAAVSSGIDDECYVGEWRYVDMIWQATPEVRDQSDSAGFLRECMEKLGLDPESTAPEMEEQMREGQYSYADCAT